MKKIVLATHNQGKIRELHNALSLRNEQSLKNFQWLSMTELNIPSPLEDKMTFIENALLKARHCAEKSNLPALADDSGLCVLSLNNAPGVHSARFAGEYASDQENYAKLLNQLGSNTDRRAFFYCCLAFVRQTNDPTPMIAEGYWYGEILKAPEGNQGFGYDPIFQGENCPHSAAFMSREKKLQHSHRGQAIQSFLQQWQKAALLNRQ